MKSNPHLQPSLLSSLRVRTGGLFLLATTLLSIATPAHAVTSVPQPVTTHPRLWITQADVPKYQSWAVSTNPIYKQGILPTLAQATADYNACFPGGKQANPYPDFGDVQGYTGVVSEQAAWVLAFQSLIDPVAANRIKYAQEARNLIMVAINQAALGPLSGAPFRDPAFAIYNRASENAAAYPLVVDWIYNTKDAQNHPILTTADKATIRKVFMIWAQQCLNASTTGGDHPDPIGAVNSMALLPGNNAYRMAANNYYSAHIQLLTLMSLSLDPADDPVLDVNRTPATLGNTLRSYIPNATGAWLYQQYAMYGEPAAIRSAYGLPLTSSVGLSSGGMPAEGLLYGVSFSSVIGEMLALKTAGFATTALSGPQAALADGHAPVWDRFTQAILVSLVPAAQTPTLPANFNNPLTQIYDPNGESYLGQVYQFASYGDILRMFTTPNYVSPFALLSLLDQKSGVTSRQAAENWFIVNGVQGGKAQLLSRVGNPWSYGVQDTLLTYMALDPVAAPAYNYADPRPGFATDFYDAPQGRLVEHTNWTSAGSMFDFRCNWLSINHQQSDAGQFELYRKGEWLTKGLANYDDAEVGQSTDFHNTLSLQNWCSLHISATYPNGIPSRFIGQYDENLWRIGSQFSLAGNAGDPTAITSVTPAYTFADGNTTNLYNTNPNPYTPADAASDIKHASRSILWLKPDHIVVYDRGTSLHQGFKRLSFTVVGNPVVNGNQVTTTTHGGQHLYLNTLLPNTGTTAITTNTVASANIGNIAELETANNRVTIEDTAKPLDARFLHVLQGADANKSAEVASLIKSSSGTPFDGAALVGKKTVVMFKRDTTTPFVSTTFTVPATTTTYYVTGLTPFAGYTIAQSGQVVTITPGGPTGADKAGVLTGPAAAGTVLPMITSQPTPQSVAAAATANFTLQAIGTGPLVYKWQRLAKGATTWADLVEGATYQGTATATLSIVKVNAGMSGDRFRCSVVGSKHTVWTTSATLTTLTAPPVTPVLTSQPVNQIVVLGKNAVYSVTATGRGALAYQWQQSADHGATWKNLLYSGAYWDGGSTPALTIRGVTKAQNGYQFRCVVTNGTKPDGTSHAVTLVVIPSL